MSQHENPSAEGLSQGQPRDQPPEVVEDHGHPGQSEQEARISGVHGWGYGGRAPDEAEAFRGGKVTGSTPERPEGRAPEEAVTPPAEDDGAAPLDAEGHHPDWRR